MFVAGQRTHSRDTSGTPSRSPSPDPLRHGRRSSTRGECSHPLLERRMAGGVRAGRIHGRRRRWGTKGTAEVTEFRNHQAALDFNEWANRFPCRYSDQTFRVGDVPGSIGLRIDYSSGEVQERVSFVRGRRRYAVSTYTDGALRTTRAWSRSSRRSTRPRSRPSAPTPSSAMA